MGMVVRTNTMALNAYRQLGMNNNAVAKSLEKLSSGFRINRAGDDAAGLAISEKMKAQITGLETASANAQDGISLIQTAEGNLTEVHDMLNRMVELASKSANGTYTATERQALQDEMDQLLDEVDRISQSANFNGTRLLDGSLDGVGTKVIGTPTFEGLKTFDADTFGARWGQQATDKWEYEDVKVGGAWSGVTTHVDSKGSSKTSFDLRLENKTFTAATEGAPMKFNFVVEVGDTTSGTDIADTIKTTQEITIDAASAGPKELAKALYDQLGADHTIDIEFSRDADASKTVQYQVSLSDDGTLHFEMTDQGWKDAVKYSEADNGSLQYFKPNFSAGFEVLTKDGAALTDDNKADTSATGASKADGNTSNTHFGSASAAVRLAETFVGFKDPAAIKDGAGIMVGDQYYVWAGSDETLNGDYGSNVKVVDIRDLVTDKGVLDVATNNGLPRDNLNVALARMAEAAADNKVFSVQVGTNGDTLGFTERPTNTVDLSTVDKVKAQLKGFTSLKANVTKVGGTGKALTLQIGDTAESFNKMSVNIADMSAKGLNLDALKKTGIMTEESASAAIDTIKQAINSVSTARAGMGALQNRLEHTINNLDVAVENLSSANSRIRDTDMAKEMMNYTKMNVLVQSAQAMLAQANQQPQSVLQLLQ